MHTITQQQIDMVRSKMRHSAHPVGKGCEYCDAIEAVLNAAQKQLDIETQTNCDICGNRKFIMKSMVIGDTCTMWCEPCPVCTLRARVQDMKQKKLQNLDKNVKGE